MSKIIHCIEISKSYIDGKKERKILNNISVSIERGTINVIYGESGSGKTTFLSILEGLENPTTGNVFYDDRNLFKLSEKEIAKIRGEQFGIIFQNFNLLDEISVLDNIKLPLLVNSKKVDEGYFKELILRMKINDLLNKYPNQLSGGEKQRVAIARAMINKPKILFADEPTGNLDEKNTLEIASLFYEINNRFDTTIMLVTHDKELIQNPDNIMIIKNEILEKKDA